MVPGLGCSGPCLDNLDKRGVSPPRAATTFFLRRSSAIMLHASLAPGLGTAACEKPRTAMDKGDTRALVMKMVADAAERLCLDQRLSVESVNHKVNSFDEEGASLSLVNAPFSLVPDAYPILGASTRSGPRFTRCGSLDGVLADDPDLTTRDFWNNSNPNDPYHSSKQHTSLKIPSLKSFARARKRRKEQQRARWMWEIEDNPSLTCAQQSSSPGKEEGRDDEEEETKSPTARGGSPEDASPDDSDTTQASDLPNEEVAGVSMGELHVRDRTSLDGKSNRRINVGGRTKRDRVARCRSHAVLGTKDPEACSMARVALLARAGGTSSASTRSRDSGHPHHHAGARIAKRKRGGS